MRNALIVLSCLFTSSLAMAQVIPANSPPVADAGADQIIYLGDSVTLHGSATDADGEPIVGWQWEVISAPAGSTYSLAAANTANATFTTNMLGNYVITLMAQDYFAWGDPDAVLVTVTENEPPTAVAWGSPLEGPAPLVVTFDGAGSTDPEGGAVWFDWDFGDGTYGTGQFPIHTYDLPGTYSVVLIVTDARGLDDFDTIEVAVLPANVPPEVSATATPSSGTSPLVVQLHADASDADGDPLTYIWDFGDPTSDDNASTLPDPQHVYETPGTYIAWLTVSDGLQEVSTSVTIVVSSGQLLSTDRASVVAWDLRKANKGTISYWGDIALPTPGADDVISLTFDGIRLFSKRFGAFEAGLQPNEYLIVKRWLLVRIDLDANTIYVEAQKANLRRFDNSDGVDVELMWGDDMAVDQFVMSHPTEQVWNYER